MTNHFDGPGYVPGHAEAQAEADRRAKIVASKAPQLSPEAMAIKTALGVPAIDRTDEEKQAYEDKRMVGWALDDAKKYGGNYGARSIDNVIAKIGVDRFLAAAPPDVAAKMRALIRKERARQPEAAAPKPKPAAKADTRPAFVIRSIGSQAEIDALNAREAAEHPAACRCQSCEIVKGRSASGASVLAGNIRRNTALLNGPSAKPKSDKLSQAEIDATWREAHARVARDSGRTR